MYLGNHSVKINIFTKKILAITCIVKLYFFAYTNAKRFFPKKLPHILFTRGLVGIFFLAVGHRTPHTGFESLLKYMYMYLGQEEFQ